MSVLTETPTYTSGVYQLQTNDPVLGGPGGIANQQAQDLADRTAWLKARALASLRLEDIEPVSGSHTISAADIGQVLSVHDPDTTSFNLPALGGFPEGNPFMIVVRETGSGTVVNLNTTGGDLVEDYLGSGAGVTTYGLVQGTRIILIATPSSWVVIQKTAPPAVTYGYQVGDVAFTFGPYATRPGFLLANGSAISRTTYAALFAVYGTIWGAGDGTTTFNLPDPSGLFPRIYNTGAPFIDTGRVFGTVQADSIKDHTHDIGDAAYYTNSGGTEHPFGSGGPNPAGATDNITGADGGGTETRPKNITINAWIKY